MTTKRDDPRGRLRTKILAPIAATTLLGFSISWILTLTASRDAVNSVVNILVSEVSTRIVGRTEAELEKARTLSVATAVRLGSEPSAKDDPDTARKVFRAQIAEFPEIGIVSAGFADGSYVEAQRLPGGRIRTGMAGKETGGNLELWETDARGNPVDMVQRSPNYDPRIRPWYVAAAERGKAGWSEIYAYVSDGRLAVSSSVPFYDDAGTIAGVCSVTMNLSGLSGVLASFEEASNGLIGIVDANDRLVALSNGHPVLDPSNAKRLTLEQTDDELARTAKSLLFTDQRFDFMRTTERWAGTMSPIDRTRYPDWRVFILLDKTAFQVKLAETDMKNGLILFLTLGVSLSLALIALNRILRPLKRLGQAVGSVSPGRIDEPSRSAIAELCDSDDEIGALALSFKAMTDRIDADYAEIGASLREKEILLKEIHHRVKNNLQIIASILNIQASEQDEATITSAFEVAQERIQAMAALHEHAYRTGSFDRIDMKAYIETVCSTAMREGADQAPRIRTVVDVGTVSIPLDKAVPLGLIVNELVVNAIRHGFPGERTGTLWVSMGKSGESLVLEVCDDGIGKGASAETARKKGHAGIGSHLVESLVAQLKGSVAEPHIPHGTRIVIRFPA